jgi:hypothetical protein
MVEAEYKEAVMYVNCKAAIGRLRIVKGGDRLIYIYDTNMETGYR